MIRAATHFGREEDHGKNHGKQAQVSIFFILAGILLIGGAIFFFAQETILSKELPATTQEASILPTEFSPIQLFVEECLRQSAEEGLILIGEHGGYLSITDPALRVDSFRISTDPTESDAISLSKANAQGAVAYWWYLKSPNACTGTCELSSKRPPISGGKTSIEEQLNSYVEGRIEGCLDEFSALKEQGFSVEAPTSPRVTTKIDEEDVSVLLSYPLSLSRDGATNTAEAFAITLPVRFKQLYDLGTQISNLEMKYRFLERHALNLVVAFSGVSQEKLPPMSDVRFEFGSTLRWSKQDVENKISGFLSGYTQLFQVEGTSNFERNAFSDELAQRLYDSTLIPNPLGSSPGGIEAQFTYLDAWPLYFDLNCDGDVCRPQSANSLLSTIGLQTYNFAYDVSFPVLVELKDTEAFHGRGYTLRFALESNIRNNEPMPSTFAPLEMAEFEEATLLCDERLRNSGTITVAVDDSSKQALAGAQVLYTILDNSCYIGSTDENGELSSKFPGGVAGGAITIVHPGIITSSFDFTPTPADERVSLTVPSAESKGIMVMKKQLKKIGDSWTFIDTPIALTEKEQAIITLKRIPSDGEQEFVSVAQLDFKNPLSEAQIAPGDYEVDISLLLKQKVKFPAQTKCSRSSLFSSEVCYTLPEVDFSQGSSEPIYQSGGFKGNLTISAQKLTSADTIIFYALSPDLPATFEDLTVTQDIQGNSNTYLTGLQPTYQHNIIPVVNS